MFTLRQELESIFLVIVFTVLGLVAVSQSQIKAKINIAGWFNSTEPVYKISSTQSVVVPIQSEALSQSSSDGKFNLTMQKKVVNGQITYSFFSAELNDTTKNSIYSIITDKKSELKIPLNSFAPDNNYLYLEKKTLGVNDYLLFKSNGDTFSDGLKYLNIAELFHKRYPDLIFSEVTGWAAPNLLIVNTKTLENKLGGSFWFELPTQNFIQLSTKFY